MTHRLLLLRAVLPTAVALLATARTASAQQTCPATTPGATMPLTYQGGPTVPAITPCDLMSRLYIYAADSMRGREAGTPDAIRATAWIEGEVRRLGLRPAGDDGSYFQRLPVSARAIARSSTMTSGGKTFQTDVDFYPAGATADRKITAEVVFGGALDDTLHALSAADAQGKIVLVTASNEGRQFSRVSPNLAGAAAVALVVPTISRPRLQFVLNDTVQAEGRAASAGGGTATGRPGRVGAAGGPLTMAVSLATAGALLGKPLGSAVLGDKGGAATLDVKVENTEQPTRSVVAILEGTDPILKKEYIVIGAHADHIGVAGTAVAHDSIKAYNMVARVQGADSRSATPPTAEQWTRINALRDSLRRIYPERLDSISNGADDDGSGSVSVLEIAEAFAKGPLKPKRSLLFIWQTGEEKGLWGSQWFTNHSTVPRDAIVADLNLDMVGRGGRTDVTGTSKDGRMLLGGERYLQLVGSRRLSTELGDIVEQVNATETVPFTFDYSMDANGHPQNIYCRSDHANYARYGIPVVFFTTGGHADYHQVTDEPEYIRYDHMARVDQLVYDIASRLGNLDHRVVVDKAKPDNPFARCQQ